MADRRQAYRMLVFDWDGTVMDSAHAIVTAIQNACIDLGVEPPPEDRARHVIGLGLGDALRYAVPDLEEGRYQSMVERYRYHYLARDHELQLFAGIEALLRDEAAAGRLMAVATGKSRLGLNRALTVSGLGDVFMDSRCADECHSKPHPQMLHELMQTYDVPADEVLMIGDTTHDLQMAVNAGVDGLGVSYGAHPVTSLEAVPSRAVLHTVAELREWLRQNG